MLFIRSFVACSLMMATVAPFVDALEIPFGLVYPIHDNLDGAAAVAVADLDRDGLDDVVLAAIEADTIAIRFNGTPGSWTALTVAFDEAVTVFTADIDGDGWIDVVGGKRGTGANAVRWWKNPGAGGGTWVENPIVGTTISGVRSVVAGDMDNDGDVDLVSASFMTSTEGFVTIFENTNGEGTAWALFEVDVDAWGAHTVRLGDINGDGRLDIALAAHHLNVVGWYLNGGLAGDPWSPWAFRLIFGPVNEAIGLDLADMDDDGDLDVIAGSFADGEVAWYQNWVSYSLPWEEQPIAGGIEGAYELEVVDLDLDGDLDILAVGRTGNEVVWIERQPGAWVTRDVATDSSGARSARSADIDGDGDLDIVAVAEFDDTVAWRENVSLHWSAAFPFEGGPITGPPAVTSLATGDLDGDGELDLAATAFNETGAVDVLIWFRQGGSWSAPTAIDSDLNGAEKVRIADLNHDGHLDLIAIGSRADSLAWYEFDFIGSYTRHMIDTSIDGVIDFDLGDFDCDGDLDIAVASFLGEEIRFWENNNGDGSSWSLRVSGSLWSGASAVQVVDIDHEDGADVIVAQYGADTVSAYLNVDCGFSYTSLDITTAIDGPIDLEVGDFNRDGWEDVAVAASAGDTLDVFLNQNGTSWFKYGAATDIGGISSLSAADFDLDGALDLVATTSTGAEVLRWKNHSGYGTSWIPMGAVTDTLVGAAAVVVADLDSNGMPDIVAAGTEADRVLVFSNQGGQVTVGTFDRTPATAVDGQRAVIFEIVPFSAAHDGDPDIELNRLNLQFLSSTGGLFSDSGIQELVASVEIWFDSDGSGVFEVGLDTLLVTDAGIAASMAVLVPAGDPNPAIGYGDLESFFVTVNLTPDASTNLKPMFKVRHRLVGDTLARYHLAPWIFPASVYWESVDSGLVTAVEEDTGLIFSDGFETGTTDAWSAIMPAL